MCVQRTYVCDLFSKHALCSLKYVRTYVCMYVGVQNLDVNMAVNNLLSRDDGEHDDHDEPFQGMFSSGTYVCMQVYTVAAAPPPTHTRTHLPLLQSVHLRTYVHMPSLQWRAVHCITATYVDVRVPTTVYDSYLRMIVCLCTYTLPTVGMPQSVVEAFACLLCALHL